VLRRRRGSAGRRPGSPPVPRLGVLETPGEMMLADGSQGMRDQPWRGKLDFVFLFEKHKIQTQVSSSSLRDENHTLLL